MATAKAVVLFRKDKLSKDGKHPLYLRIIKDRKIRFLSLGHKFYKEDLDDSMRKLSDKHPLSKEINYKIRDWEIEAERVILRLEKEKKDYIAETVIEKIKEIFHYQ